jgi:hypothetical protein
MIGISLHMGSTEVGSSYCGSTEPALLAIRASIARSGKLQTGHSALAAPLLQTTLSRGSGNLRSTRLVIGHAETIFPRTEDGFADCIRLRRSLLRRCLRRREANRPFVTSIRCELESPILYAPRST